jgi:isopenicillin N synthase-like dioxygenase
MSTVDEAIPTVDISPFVKNAPAKDLLEVVKAVRHACTTYGFFYLVGHGISLEEQNQALDCAKLFFTLSQEEKMDVWIKKSLGKSHRGYEPPGIQTHQKGLLPDTKEVNPPLNMVPSSPKNISKDRIAERCRGH